MKVRILAVGSLKEKYLVLGVKEYLSRLAKFTKLEVVEVKDEPIPDNASLAIEQQIKDKEGQKLLSLIKSDEFVILLDLAGKQLTSIELANLIEDCMIKGKSTITFVIGGSLGHDKGIIDRANYRLSISKMTFPHQLARLLVSEQIYRAFKIIRNEKYHK